MRATASMLVAAVFGVVGAAQGAHQSTCAWRLSNGPLWSEKTGQHTATFVVRNRSSANCVLRGYPHVELLDGRGHVLLFTYAYRGDQMISAAQALGREGLLKLNGDEASGTDALLGQSEKMKADMRAALDALQKKHEFERG